MYVFTENLYLSADGYCVLHGMAVSSGSLVTL